MIYRPLLAATIEAESIPNLPYPLLVTPKFDGIRVLKVDGRCVTRTFKPLPNHFIRLWIEQHLPDGVDGEVMLPNRPFNETSSAVMSADGTPNFMYYIFDYVKESLDKGYMDRVADMLLLKQEMNVEDLTKVKMVMPEVVLGTVELELFEENCIKEGYEGIMIRKACGPYKCGRSTVRELTLGKLKRWYDINCEVIGFEERMENTATSTEDAFGLLEKSYRKEDLKGRGDLGALLVRAIEPPCKDVVFSVGSGFDDHTRLHIWHNKGDYLRKVVSVKYQHLLKGTPRFPIFMHFREEGDV